MDDFPMANSEKTGEIQQFAGQDVLLFWVKVLDLRNGVW